MIFILLSMLYLQSNGFLQKNILYKYHSNRLFSSINNLYQIKPYNTIIYYELNNEKKIEIQNEINKIINNKYIINTNNIYISLYDYSDEYNHQNNCKCQIFVYVHDIQNNLDGQYILKTKEYNKINTESLINSFYENNKEFYISFSYYKNYLDNVNYINDIKFDFIYEKEQPYLLNIANMCDKISYTPSYTYTSELKYKNIVWNKSNKIIYYKNSFYYKNK